jgi:hypothetical protein
MKNHAQSTLIENINASTGGGKFQITQDCNLTINDMVRGFQKNQRADISKGILDSLSKYLPAKMARGGKKNSH